jgi:hypothetical protein
VCLHPHKAEVQGCGEGKRPVENEEGIGNAPGEQGKEKEKNRKYNAKIGRARWNFFFDVADIEKGPEIEKEFLEAQRKPAREGTIAGIDMKETEKISENLQKREKKAKRKAEEAEQQEKRQKKSSEDIDRVLAKEVLKETNKEDSENNKDNEEEEFKSRYDRKEKHAKKMKEKEAKAKVAETADRFKVSNKAVSHLSNELREKDGIITKEDKTRVTNS